MGQAFLMGAGGGGYAEGDTIPAANLQPIYKEDLNYTDETRIVSNIEGVTNYGYLTVNPNGNTLYYSNNGSLRIYSATGTLISSISTSAHEFKFDSDGNAYYQENNTIKKITSNGTASDFITLVLSSTLWEWAGNTLYAVTHGSTSDGFRKYNQAGEMISEKSMNFSYLSQMVTDTNGNFYVAPNETYDDIKKYSSEGTQVATTYSGYTTRGMLWASNYLYLIRYDDSDYEVVRYSDDLSSNTTMATYSSFSNLPDVIKATTIAGTTRLFVRLNGSSSAGSGFELRDLNYGLLAGYTGTYNSKDSYNNPDVGANGEIFYLRAPKDINRLHTAITGYKVLSED